MANLPQVIVTLAPNGRLIAELPGPNGARRKVDLAGDCEATLTRILQAQLRNRIEIGLDGAPTQAQTRHWERHSIWADPSCPFCIAERGLKPKKDKARLDAVADSLDRINKGNKGLLNAGNGEVTVRRIGAKDTAKLKAKHEREQRALIKRADKAKREAELEPFFRSIGL
jgi:hypothetical protein